MYGMSKRSAIWLLLNVIRKGWYRLKAETLSSRSKLKSLKTDACDCDSSRIRIFKKMSRMEKFQRHRHPNIFLKKIMYSRIRLFSVSQFYLLHTKHVIIYVFSPSTRPSREVRAWWVRGQAHRRTCKLHPKKSLSKCHRRLDSCPAIRCSRQESG